MPNQTATADAPDTVIEDSVVPDVELADLTPGSLQAHPRNVRTDLGDLRELTDSISAKGVLQPLVVVPATAKNKWRIVAGHRRHAAAKAAGVKRIPCIIRRDLTDEADQLAAMLAENIERSDLTVLEEASAVQGLLELGDSMVRICSRTGMSKRRVSARAKVAKMSDDLKAKIAEHRLTLDDALFLDKHSEDPADAELLDRSVGTDQWPFAKQRVLEHVARREQEAKWRRDIEDAGLVLVTDYPAFDTWRAEHGWTGPGVISQRIAWDARGDRTFSPTAAVVYWLADHAHTEPDVYVYTQPPSELADPDPAPRDFSEPHTPADADPAPTPDAPPAPTVGQPEPPAELTDAQRAAQQRENDLATAATVRADVVGQTVAKEIDEVVALTALRETALWLHRQHILGGSVCDLLNVDDSDIERAITESTSWTWLALVVALAEFGATEHDVLARGGSGGDRDTVAFAELLELMGHTWSDVERETVDRVRAEYSPEGAEDTPAAEAGGE